MLVWRSTIEIAHLRGRWMTLWDKENRYPQGFWSNRENGVTGDKLSYRQKMQAASAMLAEMQRAKSQEQGEMLMDSSIYPAAGPGIFGYFCFGQSATL
jgi:hypothetical protein